ncbi:type II toxin-antitoxin system RelB/DinJ family antitoxin [Stella sp.]|uniref:type II toxin-antitoxin system RelB/DinJ family antitoxin n=1 Tax=Stella sp. TaxID=2912054 RepID=UPI0035B3CB09
MLRAGGSDRMPVAKAEGIAALEAMGLTAADAVRLLFHRIVTDQAFPLELKVPNAATRAAMAEAEAMLAERRTRFADGEALVADLDG